jgi:hypothetical protein
MAPLRPGRLGRAPLVDVCALNLAERDVDGVGENVIASLMRVQANAIGTTEAARMALLSAELYDAWRLYEQDGRSELAEPLRAAYEALSGAATRSRRPSRTVPRRLRVIGWCS